MVLAIEPMVTAGRHGVRVGEDHWAIYSQDGSLAAHFEFTVAITVGPDLTPGTRAAMLAAARPRPAGDPGAPGSLQTGYLANISSVRARSATFGLRAIFSAVAATPCGLQSRLRQLHSSQPSREPA